ncbi:MAG: methyl-accepting chemotaxis protein [Planctomycetota bacterium]
MFTRLKNLTIGKRLALGFGALATMLLLLSVTAWWQTTAINQNMDTALAQAAKMVKIKDIDASLDTLYLEMWGLVAAKDVAAKQAYKAAIDRKRKEYAKELEELKAAAGHQEDKDLLAKLEEALASARDLNQRVANMALKAQGQDAAALELFATEGAKVMADKIDPAINALITYREKRIQQTDDAAEAAFARAQWTLGIGTSLAMVLAALFSVVATRSIVLPIKDCVGFTGLLAQGDFSKEVPEVLRKRGDEMGDLARAFHTMAGNTRELLKGMIRNTQTVASSATELSATATQLASGAEETTNQSAQVAAAAEQMSTNMGGMAAATEQMSTNIKVVASAIEELTSSISEVSKSAERAAGVADNAAQLVSTSNSQIGELGGAADEIGKVIEVIQDIAEQTNLLALNATIEAARAGDAGKGFAVVATEVKELAKQTASATEDIRKRIKGIQGSAGRTVKSIGDISDVVKQVNELSRMIASAVEEQSITTKEIARNMVQSSTAAQMVSRGVAESATATHEITRNIVGVDQAARQSAQGAAQTQTTGRELSSVAEQLQGLVGQFKV